MAKLKSLTIAGEKFDVEIPQFKDYKKVGIYSTPISYDADAEVLGIKLTNNQSVMNFFTTHQAKFNNIALFAGTDLIYNTGAVLENLNLTHMNAVNAQNDPTYGTLRSSGGVILFILATSLGIRTNFREIDDDFDQAYGDTATEFYLNYATQGYKQKLNDIKTNDYDLLNEPGEITQLTAYVYDSNLNNRVFKDWKKNNDQGTIQEFLATVKPDNLGSGITNAFVVFTFIFEKIK